MLKNVLEVTVEKTFGRFITLSEREASVIVKIGINAFYHFKESFMMVKKHEMPQSIKIKHLY